MKREHVIRICAVLIVIGFIALSYYAFKDDTKKALSNQKTSVVSDVNSTNENEIMIAMDDSDLSQNNSSALSGKDYYQSSKELPKEEDSKQLNKLVLSGLTKEQIKTVQETIHNRHMLLEGEIVNHNLWKNLKSPSSDNWQEWERKGHMNINGLTIINQTDGKTYIDELEDVKNILGESNPIVPDIQKMQQVMKTAVKEHDVVKIFLFHQMIHDCDYWVVNYPIQFSNIAPPDWGGIKYYYGVLSIKN